MNAEIGNIENTLFGRRPELTVCKDDIEKAYGLIKKCYEQGGKMLICGNGGSAADSEHLAGELNKSFKIKRPIENGLAQRIEKICPGTADKLEAALPAIPLPSLISSTTAYINDRGAETVYAQLALALGKEGDILCVFSTSGNSANCVKAAAVAKAAGISVISFTGSTGGKLAFLSDCTVRVPSDETYEVQEYHLSVYHALAAMEEEFFFGKAE